MFIYLVSVLFISNFKLGFSSDCFNLNEKSRVSCLSSSSEDCLRQGCCWDGSAIDTRVQCYKKSECKKNYFGWGCKFWCDGCNECDPLTGECTSECEAGRWGIGCMLEDSCTYNDNDARYYKGRLAIGISGRNCLTWAKYASNSMKFADGSRQAAQNYCRNPFSSGTLSDTTAWCYYMTSSSERKYQLCKVSSCLCPSGRFGVNCEQECHCKSLTEQCEASSGACPISGCNEHFAGRACQDCADGYFRKPHCRGICHCRNPNEVCDKETGNCVSACADGWQGSDCQKECSDGYFGQECQYRCNCKDELEGCNKVNGFCKSGCKAGYAGRDCRSELPRITRPPVLSNRDGSSITIKWYKWRSPPDTGEGPVKSYILEYAKSNALAWKMETYPDAASPELRVTNLEQNTNYTFRILTVNSENIAGLPSPDLQAKTCGKPDSGPVSLTVVESTDAGVDSNDIPLVSLQFLWDAPSSLTWGCDRIVTYKVYIKTNKTFDFLKDVDGTVTSVPDMDSNYTLGVSLVNSANLESNIATKAVASRPGHVRNLRYDSTPSSLIVTWEPPTQQNEPIQLYTVTHRLLQHGSCAEFKRPWEVLTDVDVKDDLKYTAKDLLPFSRYQIVVQAYTKSGKGLPTVTIGITEGQAPSMPVRNFVRAALTSWLVTYTWKPLNCSEENGRAWGYRHRLYDITGGSSDIIDESTQPQTSVSLTLIPHTQYKFSITFVNDYGDGPETVDVFWSPQARPPPVRNFRVFERTSNMVKVKFDPPSPPNGIISQYELKYWQKNTSNITTINLLPSQLEYAATNLRTNVTFAFQIRAYTEPGSGNWSDIVYGLTEEGVPEEPKNFRNSSRSTTSLSFIWEPPINTNGILLQYRVQCSPVIFDYKLAYNEKFKDKYETVAADVLSVELTDLLPGMEYMCAIRAKTSKGFGKPFEARSYYTVPKSLPSSILPALQLAKVSDTSAVISIDGQDFFERLHNYKAKWQLVVIVEEFNPVTAKISRRDVDGEPVNATSTPPSSEYKSPCDLPRNELVDYDKAQSSGSNCYIAADISNEDDLESFTVGDGKTYGDYINKPLQPDNQYYIWLGVDITVDGVSTSSFTKSKFSVSPIPTIITTPQPDSASGVTAGVIVAVILVILIIGVVIFFVIKRRQPRKHRTMAVSGLSDNTDVLETMTSMRGLIHERSVEEEDGWEGRPLVKPEAPPVSTRPRYESVMLPNLLAYITEKEKNRARGFQQEYEALPAGVIGRCDCARRPENKTKNRYGNTIAYDVTRVILETLPDDPDSDYINANHIDGYKKPRAYIATQGPMKQTVNDFWRMIWQENCARIVMVTNLIEDGKHKCEQYWPDSGSATYGNFIIEKIDDEEYADFTIRTFNMSREGTQKLVRQFHFTAWPDHGVPAYATSLLAFRRKVHVSDETAYGPIVVHCSAGVGRTGTFIMVDMLLDQAKAEGEVDVFGNLKRIREQRTNLVQATEQYMFVYHALLEAYESGETAIPSRHLHQKFADLTRPQPDSGLCRLETEFNLLTHFRREMKIGYIENKEDSKEIVEENQFITIEGNQEPDMTSSVPPPVRIPGVFIDGYRQREAFLLVSSPTNDSAGDFWNAVYTRDCKTVVTVTETGSKQSISYYYPHQMETEETFGQFLISLLSTDKSDDNIVVREFRVAWLSKPSQGKTIRLFEYIAWNGDSSVPPSSASLLSLLASVERWQQRSGNKTVLVNCRDGATRSGLYLAVSNVIERLKLEQEVDVLLTAKLLRVKHAKILPNLDQYRYVYQSAVDYLDGFETYANFK